MSKLVEAYIRDTNPDAKKIEKTSFRYSDMGNNYSYVEFDAVVDGEDYREQLDMEQFFEWIGASILKINSNTKE